MIETTEESKRYLSRHRKLDRDRVDWLKEENVCRDKENYVVTGSRSGRTKEADCKQILCRNTKQSCCDTIKTATPQFCRDSIKVYHDSKSSKVKSRQKITSYDKGQRQGLKAMSRHNFLCRDKATNLGQTLGIHNVINKVRPNI